MSTNAIQRSGSSPGRIKKEELWLRQFGNFHLSNKPVKESFPRNDIADILTIASVMSLCGDSNSQDLSCQAPRRFEVPADNFATRKAIQVNSWRKQAATTKLKTTQTPKDFGKRNNQRSNNTFADANSIRASSQQDCTNWPWVRSGKCEIVVKSTIQQKATSKSSSVSVQANKKCDQTVLGFLPLLSCVFHANNQLLSELLCQANAVKTVLSIIVLSVRLMLLGNLLKNLETLGRQGASEKVNSTKTENNNNNHKNYSEKVKVKVTSAAEMANHNNLFLGGFGGEDAEMGEGNGWGDFEGNAEVPRVPDYGDYVDGGDGYGDDEEYPNGGRRLGGNGAQGGDEARVPEVGEVEDAAHPLGDDFANKAICDFEEMEAYINEVNAPEAVQFADLFPPHDEDVPLFMDLEMDQLVLAFDFGGDAADAA